MQKRIKRLAFRALVFLPLSAAALVFVFPLVYLLANTFMSAAEIEQYYGAIHTSGGAVFHIIPDSISLEGYYAVFLERPDYLIKFWNSLYITALIVAGQMLVSCLAGFAFAKFRFPFRNGLFFLYIVFMMLPFIVTLVPNEIVIRRLGLMDTTAALVLPGIFAPFGAFLMRQVISSVPDSLIEAGRLEGANRMHILFRLVLPQCKSGIASVTLLSFIDSWNMVEQPLVFLKSFRKYPLSVFMSNISYQRLDLVFVCGALMIVPVLLLFFFFRDELIEGISYMGMQ